MRYETVARLHARAAIRRRRQCGSGFRTGLRGLLMLVAATMLGRTRLGSPTAPGWEPCTDAAAIYRAGGSFFWDGSYAGWPARLTGLVGIGHFEHIVSIAGGPRFDPEVYARIGALRQLQTLITYPGTVNDAGMAHLGRLTGLSKLQVTTRRASPASVGHLAGMTRLKTLRVYGVPVGDDDLAVLAGMGGLQELQLDSPRITNAGLARHIARLSALESLGVHGRGITDSGLALLRGLPHLRELDLSGTMLTDAGLTHLVGLRDLDTLTVRRTLVTAAGLAELRKARPGIQVVR